MHNPTLILAERENFGRVYDCGDCGSIHVQVGPVSITFSPEGYMDLVEMLLASAASFETHMQRLQEEGKGGLCDS